MVDFSQLLKKPAGLAKKAPALPMGDFPGKIKSFELLESQQKKTPFVRYNLAATGWPESAGEDEKVDAEGKPINLEKKTLRKDYFITEDALWRLDEFLRGIGVNLEGRSYEEAVPDAVGADVLMVVTQRLDQRTSETFNDVADLKPLA